jgi:hypothetical protein
LDDDGDGISMLTLSITDSSGNELKFLEHEAIGDTISYIIPCGMNATVNHLNLSYTVPSGVTDSLIGVKGIGGDRDRSGEVTPTGIGSFSVDMHLPGRKTLTVALRNAEDSVKLYTIALEKRFELLDIVNEHLHGYLRVVNNNPENTSKLKFISCDWYYKSAGRWEAEFDRLYIIAGPHIPNTKFDPNDSMYVEALTVGNDRIITCPAINRDSSAAYAEDSVGANAGNKSVEASVYPNPVAAGGTIRLKQLELLDGEEELYATLYLFDAQGRLVLTDNASTLRSGLTMPETPGVYHLVLEGKAGRKVVRVAVGQKN